MREFPFELSVCARLEADRSTIVARQLGGGVSRPGGRILDVVCVDPGPEFAARATITDETIPRSAIDAAVGPGRFRPATSAIDGPPERARAVAQRAAEIGFFEVERRNGQIYVRQATRYPDDWFGDILAIENKPDLDRPGELDTQLRTDVSLGLVDRVVLATASHVTGAHLNRLPDEVGVWQVEPGDERTTIEVIREPSLLATDEPGVELLDRHPGRVDIDIATDLQRSRRRIAERAYGKGWRTYDLPACEELSLSSVGCPNCAWAGQVIDPGTACGTDCPGYTPGKPLPVDLAAERARRSPWRRDPDGPASRQVGLDRFRRD